MGRPPSFQGAQLEEIVRRREQEQEQEDARRREQARNARKVQLFDHLGRPIK